MGLLSRVRKLAEAAADGYFALRPQPHPGAGALAAARIVAHRGAHDGRRVPENTLAAFDRAAAAGIWGIEFDLRFTSDRVPVVSHDPDLGRVFGDPLVLAETTYASLRARQPGVPTLAEVVDRYGGRLHLMPELKDEPWPDPEGQARTLADLLGGLEPARDYHVLGLDPALFDRVPFVPRGACLPVAELNVDALSRAALEEGLGGLTGHYLLLTEAVLARHRAAGQGVGTGFVASRNALYRELNRGVDWIFTNHAVRLADIIAGNAPPTES